VPCTYTSVVRHTEKPTAQTAHLVFADTKANPEKTKRDVLFNYLKKYVLYIVNYSILFIYLPI